MVKIFRFKSLEAESVTAGAGSFTTLNATGTTHTFGVSNPASDTTFILYGAGAANRLHRMFAAAQVGISFQTGSQAVTGPCMASGGVLRLAALGLIRWGTNNNNAAAGSDSIELARDADDTLAQRRGGNAQTFRLYTTYASGTSFERLSLRGQTTNNFIIATEKGTTGGAARGLELRTDSVTRLTLGDAGGVTIADANDIAVGTTTGTKIGTATNQLLGFYGVTPVDQPALTADLLDSLQEIGLVASGSGDTPLNLSGGTLTAGNLVLTDNDGAQTATFDAQSKLTANRTVSLTDRSGAMVLSDTTVATGADAVTNIVSLTQAEYNDIGSPDSATLFLITDP